MTSETASFARNFFCEASRVPAEEGCEDRRSQSSHGCAQAGVGKCWNSFSCRLWAAAPLRSVRKPLIALGFHGGGGSWNRRGNAIPHRNRRRLNATAGHWLDGGRRCWGKKLRGATMNLWLCVASAVTCCQHSCCACITHKNRGCSEFCVYFHNTRILASLIMKPFANIFQEITWWIDRSLLPLPGYGRMSWKIPATASKGKESGVSPLGVHFARKTRQ